MSKRRGGLPVGTYQDRVSSYAGVSREEGDRALSMFGELYGRLQRNLFADLSKGRNLPALKSEYFTRERIPARLFNSLRTSVEGKVSGVRAAMALRRGRPESAVSRAERVVCELESAAASPFVLHHKRRRMAALRHKLAGLEADIAADRFRLCFGSRKLWRKQYILEASGYRDHGEWLAGWQDARSNEFFLMGSRDETSGCQLCVATVRADGLLDLRLRLPDALAEEHGCYLVIEGVHFNHGHGAALPALESCREYRWLYSREGRASARASALGQPLSYRFIRDKRGWRVFVSTGLQPVPVATDRRNGAIGVDINADHLAVAEVDHSGNPVSAWRVPLVTYGLSKARAEALIGGAAASVVGRARELGKPVVLEHLDFRAKRAVLEVRGRRYSRILSSFTYSKVQGCFRSRGYREGVEVTFVNPAYSSVIGRVKFMERYGLSVHQAAGVVLARRMLGGSEGIPRRRVAPVGNGALVAFFVPVRKRVKHVWTIWGAVLGQLRPALAAQRRLGEPDGCSNPVRAGPRVEARGVA